MEHTIVGKYKEHEVYLIEQDGMWFVAFGKIAHRYWLKALNNILKEQPTYKFTTQDEIEVDMVEFALLLEKINNLVVVL